jgi:NADH dehydrogenase
MGQHRVVIVGGGFAGLAAARALGGEAVAVTLIDRRNFHLFQPLLYRGSATGGLSPAEICRADPDGAPPPRERAPRFLAEVTGFDLAAGRVLLTARRRRVRLPDRRGRRPSPLLR